MAASTSTPPNLPIVPKLEPKPEPFHPSDEPTPLRRLTSDEDDLLSEYLRLSNLFHSLSPSPSPPSKRHKKTSPRSGEMVRVSSLSDHERRCLSDLVRRTRATYECLRLLLIREEEKGILVFSAGRRSRSDLKAAALMMERDLWINREKRVIGAVPGVNVGDVFFFRIELCVVGLHGQVQGGIDFVPASRSSSGEPIATSIVVSGGYEDDVDSGNVIVYTGHGGRHHNMCKHSVDQKLSRGNMALERSLHYGIEVRVVRGFQFDGSPSGRVYVYDGLFRVVEFWGDVGKSGFGVYKYKLVRVAGQEVMGSVVLKCAFELKEKLLESRPEGYLSRDISMGKENFPISLFNDIDDEKDPLLFDYVVQPVYPPIVHLQNANNGNVPCGCACVTNCSEDCLCLERNGGEFPYDANGILIMGKPLIYECGSSCRCPPSCRNRVSQKGVRNRLEVFRSRETGWGVRSLDVIRAGSFLCEFTGVVLTQQQTDVVSMNGDGLVYPHRFPNRWFEWGDLSHALPEHIRHMIPVLSQSRFSVDVSSARNVACYLSHSCSPNVFLQFVLFDHYNVLYPHLMIFAMENILPLRELCIDYGVGDGWVANVST